MFIRLSLVLFFSAITVFSQVPQIGPGVSSELAKWRAARYSDVRYKLNLTLEKMSPVLKGTIEIRVNVRDAGKSEPGAVATGLQSSPPYEGGVDAALGGRGGSLIVLDWRKIRGSENLSTISSVSINGRSVENHPVGEAPPPLLRKEGSFAYTESNEHLIFRDGVKAGENVIKLDFTSPILTSGSAITRYVDKEDGAEYIYSLFVPSDASTAFPVFDQPDLKAVFTIYVSSPPYWKVISNGKPAGGITLTSGGTNPVVHWFAETKPISTYVFAFAAGPWENVSVPPAVAGGAFDPGAKTPPATAGGTDKNAAGDPATNIYVRKSQAAKFKPHATEVFRLTREGIKYLETYFDYKFPFPKYDIVLIPEFPFGGMEHAGATFLREDRVIFPQEPTKGDYISRANLIFHETAHQWFGDTVTMKWFDDLWLKEGFAEFMAYKTLEKVMPEANAWKVFYERNKQAAYLTDSTKGTTPIYQEIANLNSAKSAYGNIVYRKAPSFLRQAEFYLGEDRYDLKQLAHVTDDKFQIAVRAFLKKYAFANAGWQDLVHEFEAASGKKLTEWANNWVKEPGLTVFRLKRYPKGDSAFMITATPTDSLGQAIDRHVTTRSIAVMSNDRHDAQKPPVRTFLPGTREAWIHFYLGGTGSYAQLTVPFYFPNYGDYGYGIFLLDDKSRDYVLKNIQNEKDPFLRSMMWGSLWDSVREAELDPKEYVELVVRNLGSSELRLQPRKTITPKGVTLNGESDESTIATLLGRVSTAMNYYLPAPSYAFADARASASGADRADLQARLEAVLIERMQNAPTLGQRITFYRAFLNIASTEKARIVFKQMLKSVPPAVAGGVSAPATKAPPATAGGTDMSGAIPLRLKDRYDIVTKLLILNDPEASKLLDDLIKTDTSDEARRYAYAARAGIATAENKAKFWTDYTTNKDISESWIEGALSPFNSVRNSDLTLPYLERALRELPNLKRNRKIFFVNAWLAAFIGGQRSEDALNIVNKFLADNPGLDKDLRLKILENADLVERAVKIREKYGAK